ncbi:membrane protein [Deinococcus piscis]|uniref:Membrane protein n=1 Tax=Deinococcus piscis TaxID=394230 RepID=A0ABQ3K0X3_9DEIO|nr:DUF2243 domain-containing protein [Deinococcus piscis]GHF97255.1 membrane protein [Deinococcus piscis]
MTVSAASAQPSPTLTPAQLSRNAWIGVLLGIGLVAAIDEIGLHQLLAWHHFYDKSTPKVGLFSDGVFHAAQMIALIAGAFMTADMLQARAFSGRMLAAGVVTGMGAFQLWDGTINHKVLAIHQIRYGVEILPYDLTWNVVALALLLTGVTLWRRGLADPAAHQPQ